MAAAAGNYEMYRASALGRSFTDALDEMINQGHIPPDLALKALAQMIRKQYDKSMAEAIQKQVKTKTNMKGHLKTYRSVDDVWNFTIQNATLKLEGGGDMPGREGGGGGANAITENVTVEKIKILACKGSA